MRLARFALRLPFASRALLTTCTAVAGFAEALPAAAQNQSWIQQWGSPAVDQLLAAAQDGLGGAYVGGLTRGDLVGPSAGSFDAWFARYDGLGNQLWMQQFGSPGFDSLSAAAADGSGGVIVAGQTAGSLGGTSAGGADAWFARYDGSGNQLWIKQLGTNQSEDVDAAAWDSSSGLFLGGTTGGSLGGTQAGTLDAWIARYDNAGNQIWIRQLGTTGWDDVLGIALDGSGGVYVSGKTQGSLGGPLVGAYDAWFARYDSAGNQLWIKQIGTASNELFTTTAADASGGMYVCGSTEGSLAGPNLGNQDAWLARYDGAGNQLWIEQFGTVDDDDLHVAATDGSGGVFVSGDTWGSLGGPAIASADVWLARYSGTGNRFWAIQFGTTSSEYPLAIAPDGIGGLFLGGETHGALSGSHVGLEDAWLARFDSSCAEVRYCTPLVSSQGCTPAMSWQGNASLTNPAGFTVIASQLEPAKDGVLFFGTSGANNLPFFGGTLCVKAPHFRLPIQNSGGAISCSGTLTFNLSQMLAHPGGGALLTSGALVNCQVWFRDPAAPLSVGLTDAVEFTICN